MILFDQTRKKLKRADENVLAIITCFQLFCGVFLDLMEFDSLIETVRISFTPFNVLCFRCAPQNRRKITFQNICLTCVCLPFLLPAFLTILKTFDAENKNKGFKWKEGRRGGGCDWKASKLHKKKINKSSLTTKQLPCSQP